MVVGPAGFPRSLQSYFTIEMTSIGTRPRELLAGPVGLTAEGTRRPRTPVDQRRVPGRSSTTPG